MEDSIQSKDEPAGKPGSPEPHPYETRLSSSCSLVQSKKVHIPEDPLIVVDVWSGTEWKILQLNEALNGQWVRKNATSKGSENDKDYFESQDLGYVSWIDPRTVVYYQAKRLLGLHLWKEALDMFQNVCNKNSELGTPFRDEEMYIETCRQKLSAKSWIKGERAEAVDEQLIIFEKGKAYMKSDKLNSAMDAFARAREMNSTWMKVQKARNIFDTRDSDQTGEVKVWKVEHQLVITPKPKRGFFESFVSPKPVEKIQHIEIITPSPIFEEGVSALGMRLSAEDIKSKVDQISADTINFSQYRRFFHLVEEVTTLSQWRSIDHQSAKSGGQYRGYIHSHYGSVVIISASAYDPIGYRVSSVDRLQYFSDLNSSKALADSYETFQKNEMVRYGMRIIDSDYQEVLARLAADAQGVALQEGEGSWGSWDLLAQSHSLVCRGQETAQMRCLFLTPSGITLFGRDVKTVVVDKGGAEEVSRVAALQRLADGGFQVRNVGEWQGPCLYVASTGLTDVPVNLSKVGANLRHAEGTLARNKKQKPRRDTMNMYWKEIAAVRKAKLATSREMRADPQGFEKTLAGLMRSCMKRIDHAEVVRQAAARFEQGMRAMRARLWSEAKAHFEEAHRLDPERQEVAAHVRACDERLAAADPKPVTSFYTTRVAKGIAEPRDPLAVFDTPPAQDLVPATLSSA